MPRIKLKPNSPEYADKDGKNRQASRPCDMPGCARHGEHKAPKHRGLNEYHWFCLEHVQEYNKAWDFFSGMSEKEVQDQMYKAIYGERPTWRFDLHSNLEDALRRRAWQTYNFTDKEPPKDGDFRQSAGSDGGTFLHKEAPEYEAMRIMGLEPPIDLDTIKKRYKYLAKKHHPDHNQGDKESEELLKEINMAYTILKVAYEDFTKLPERN